jgi:hypothetical protein
MDLAYKLQKDHGVEAEDLARQFLPEGVLKFSDLNEEQAKEAVGGFGRTVELKDQRRLVV